MPNMDGFSIYHVEEKKQDKTKAHKCHYINVQ